MMILRYSATHKVEHNKVYRLDALDTYNQKLVKKIAVRGIATKGLKGTNGYFYLEGIRLSESKPPVGVLEIEQKTASGIKRIRKLVEKGTDLFVASGELDQYKGFTVVDIDARGVEGFGEGYVEFTNGERLTAGTTSGDTNEDTLHRLQIRESIKAHFEKEQELHAKRIKVLSLFFIDTVAKYRPTTSGSPRSITRQKTRERSPISTGTAKTLRGADIQANRQRFRRLETA